MDLFSRIAAQQGGQAPVLRPVLPPRFAPLGGVTQAQGGDMEAPVHAAPTHEVHGHKTGAAGDSETGPAHADVLQSQRARATADQNSLRSPVAPTSPHAAPLTAPAHLAEPAAQHPLQVSLPHWAGNAAKNTADAITPDTRDASQPAAQREGPLSRLPAGLTAASSRQASTAPKPPLSAARASALSPQPGPAAAAPVVHVHIARIELRAPAAAPARAAPARAARTAPQRSLSDYLRGGGQS